MCPAVMSQYIYSQRYGLKDQARVQVLVPEHEKQCESVQVADPEIVFAVSSCQKHASQPQYRRYQVYQQDRSITSDGEKRIVYYLLHHFQLTFGQIFLLRCSTTINAILQIPPAKPAGVSGPLPRTPSAALTALHGHTR